MAPVIRAELVNAAQASDMFEAICALYDHVFAQPPFVWTDQEPQHHRDLLTRLIADPTFGISAARADAELIGFAYGYRLPADTQWWQDFTEPPPPGVGQEWAGRTFALIDLAVHEAWRGHGLGRSLTQTLLQSRQEQRATLSVQPAAAATQAFYVHLGWRKVGRKAMPPGIVSPFFDIYTLDLGASP